MSVDPPLDFPDLPRSELERSIEQLVESAHGVLATQGRLRNLLTATRSIAEDLDLPEVLRRIAQAAVDLVGAEYGALGVIGPDGNLEQFIHVGLSSADADAIGHLPRGRGILGALITDPRPVRLDHLAQDPRSVGFPAHHPAMDNFVGVPIRVRGEVFGNLYLTNRPDGPFKAEDEELLMSLAASAGVAIDNARLFGETQRRQSWALATAEVSAALLEEDGVNPLNLIAQSIMALTDAATVLLVIQTTAGALAVSEAWGEEAEQFTGRVFPLEGSVAGGVIASGNPAISFGLTRSDTADGELFTGPALSVALPLVSAPRAALVSIRSAGSPRYQEPELEMVSDFAAHVSVALELREARRARERVALLEDRSRIARDLHDNVIQRLFGAGLSLNSLDVSVLPTPTRDKVELISGLLDDAISEIRTSVFALRASRPRGPAARHRLLDVVSEAAGAFPTPPRVTFVGDLDALVPAELVDDLEAVVREGLSNAARHAHASTVAVSIHADAEEVVVLIEDDGDGPSAAERSSGLGNLAARAQGWGGESRLLPRAPSGSVLDWRIPTPPVEEETR